VRKKARESLKAGGGGAGGLLSEHEKEESGGGTTKSNMVRRGKWRKRVTGELAGAAIEKRKAFLSACENKEGTPAKRESRQLNFHG